MAVGETEHKASIVRAGRWHDLGKVHEVFDATMHACEQAPSGFLAKSPCRSRHGRKFFRHELASMLAWLAQHDGEPDADLIAYYRKQADAAGIDVATSLQTGPMTMIGGENGNGTSFSLTTTREDDLTKAQLSIGRGLE